MKLYTVINNANSCYTGKFNTKEEAQALADKLNDEAIEQGNHQIFYNVGLVEFFTSDAKVEDVMLSKHGYNDDYLTWTYMGKEYWAEGEFYVDDSNVLHHTFIAPNGREIEIVCDYE